MVNNFPHLSVFYNFLYFTYIKHLLFLYARFLAVTNLAITGSGSAILTVAITIFAICSYTSSGKYAATQSRKALIASAGKPWYLQTLLLADV